MVTPWISPSLGYIISLPFFLIPLAVVWPAEPTCVTQSVRQVFDTYRGKSIPLITAQEKRAIHFDALFPTSETVTLGITDSGHYYVTAGGHRIDSLNSTYARTAKAAYHGTGYVFHFPDIPKEKIAAWVEKVQKNPVERGYRASCVHGACAILKAEFGIRVAGSTGTNIFSLPTFEKMLLRGFKDETGNAVPFQIYRMSERTPSLDRLARKLRSQDLEGAAFFGLYAGIGFGVYYVVNVVWEDL